MDDQNKIRSAIRKSLLENEEYRKMQGEVGNVLSSLAGKTIESIKKEDVGYKGWDHAFVIRFTDGDILALGQTDSYDPMKAELNGKQIY
jgi:hypothetical protein